MQHLCADGLGKHGHLLFLKFLARQPLLRGITQRLPERKLLQDKQYSFICMLCLHIGRRSCWLKRLQVSALSRGHTRRPAALQAQTWLEMFSAGARPSCSRARSVPGCFTSLLTPLGPLSSLGSGLGRLSVCLSWWVIFARRRFASPRPVVAAGLPPAAVLAPGTGIPACNHQRCS